jgi:hypothetical protein
MSCSTFNRHRHDAPAQYDLGRTLYPVADCCCSGWEAAVAGGGGDAAGGDDAGGDGVGGGDWAVSLALTRRVGSSSDARLGEQVGHFELDFAVAGGR